MGRARARLQPGPAPLPVPLPLLALAACVAAAVAVAVAAADDVREAQCALLCTHHGNRSACAEQCVRERAVSKAGSCPGDLSALSAFEAACITACAHDGDCPATDKCCPNACGATCQRAQQLDVAPGLSAVPVNVSASERGHGRVHVQWRLPGDDGHAYGDGGGGGGDAEAQLVFVVQERHHVGQRLARDRLGAWGPLHRGVRPHCLLPRGLIRPGRWYQFRVAAVNRNGTRGFSQPSPPFRLSAAPRPPGMPEQLSVGRLSAGENGTLRGELTWRPPAESDLPVARYRVYWSRELEPARSLLVKQHTVPRDVTRFCLRDLLPGSLYFVQVQALAQFGSERLKSEKAAIFLNTTAHAHQGVSPETNE
ncbi:anosmin-1 [Schistocerca serialis cubense]|uniref:anosmin-1 n=1 Tax=Schistocerca serialis cubense TaxID=2023355 RepID=UPI00214F5D28|nr:anosmin-1 [Schistocerca serialis cubense]